MTLEDLAKHCDELTARDILETTATLANRLLRIRELLVVDGMVMAPKNTAEAREILELLEREV